MQWSLVGAENTSHLDDYPSSGIFKQACVLIGALSIS
jgi:hypothetical protein